jgi:hypothetical protein
MIRDLHPRLRGALLRALPAVFTASTAAAQQHMHTPAPPSDPLGVSMTRSGSGTTWTPDAVTLPSKQWMVGDWHLMAHGFAFAEYDKQGGARGDDQFGSLNWGMGMAARTIAGGRFTTRLMLSLDPWTVTPRGYPLLLQSGETYRGEPLHDRQHPHDFWMEAAAMYERPISKALGIELYAAPSGEPALAPVAFMHRPSAMDNPMAPLGHHWQDATHVSFGVLTAGLFTHNWKLEASAFNGREPDEHRWNMDRMTLDSYSTRATLNPNANWSFTAGYGYLKSPEAHEPTESIHRFVASALQGKKLGDEGQWGSALIYGANKKHRLTQSVLLESEAVLDRSYTVYGRAEAAQKSAEDLVLPDFDAERLFNVGSVTLGGIGEIGSMWGATLGFGASGTINVVPKALETAYGSRTPLGAWVFLRLRPVFAKVDPMAGMKM